MRYQKIYSQIWHDEKFIALGEDAKFLFFYLLTSPHNNSVGLYILPKQYALADLNWKVQRFKKPFAELLKQGFIMYDETVRLLCIKNHLKHNTLENENQCKAAAKIVASLPKSSLYSDILEQLGKPFHKPLVERLRERYGKPETEAGTETEALTEPETGAEIYSQVIDYLNLKAETNYMSTSEKTRKLIKARLKEGFTVEDFFTAINKKVAEWKDDPKWSKFLRPQTLFGEKFEGYLNQKDAPRIRGTSKTDKNWARVERLIEEEKQKKLKEVEG